MTDIPIACTLAPDQLRDRVAFIERLAADALIDRAEIDGGVRSRFRHSPDVEEGIRRLVAAESECCAFLSFAVTRHEAELWLDVTGSPEARPVIEQLLLMERS